MLKGKIIIMPWLVLSYHIVENRLLRRVDDVNKIQFYNWYNVVFTTVDNGKALQSYNQQR